MLSTSFTSEVKEVHVKVLGSFIGAHAVSKDLDFFVNCFAHYYSYAVDLDQKMLITAFENVANCFKK